MTCHKLMGHSINENEVMGDKKNKGDIVVLPLIFNCHFLTLAEFLDN